MYFYSTLQKIRTEDISQAELNRFIEKLVKIALRFVRYNSGRLKNVVNEYQCDVLEDIAIDSIIPLVTESKEQNKMVLSIQFGTWEPEIKNEEEALFFLSKVISLSVNQQISSLLREYDPFFSKILDSLNYYIKSQNYYKKNFAGKLFVVEEYFDLSLIHFVEKEQLFSAPVELFIDKKFLLQSLFVYYKKIFSSPVAIPLYDLVYRLKELSYSNEITGITPDPSESFEINEIIKKGFANVYEKIENSYLKKGKLNENEFFQITEALKLIGNDLMDGGINPGLYYYLSETMPGLTSASYQAKYHNIFEYMVKIYRQKLVELLN